MSIGGEQPAAQPAAIAIPYNPPAQPRGDEGTQIDATTVVGGSESCRDPPGGAAQQPAEMAAAFKEGPHSNGAAPNQKDQAQSTATDPTDMDGVTPFQGHGDKKRKRDDVEDNGAGDAAAGGTDDAAKLDDFFASLDKKEEPAKAEQDTKLDDFFASLEPQVKCEEEEQKAEAPQDAQQEDDKSKLDDFFAALDEKETTKPHAAQLQNDQSKPEGSQSGLKNGPQPAAASTATPNTETNQQGEPKATDSAAQEPDLAGFFASLDEPAGKAQPPAGDATTPSPENLHGEDAAANGADAAKEHGGADPAKELSASEEAALMREFMSDIRDADRSNEVERILWAFKLNPLEQLGLRFDADIAKEVPRQYRKVSLLVHPDKCKHPKASDAFEVIREAQRVLLQDEERTKLLLNMLDIAKEQVRKDRKKETKRDTTVKVASLLHDKGKEGVEADWEQSDEFHKRWVEKSRDVLARSAFRKIKLTQRLKSEEDRTAKEEMEEREAYKAEKQHERKWEKTRDDRVGTWREFQKTDKAKHSTVPKQRTHDESKLYVQRTVRENFRSEQSKKKKKK